VTAPFYICHTVRQAITHSETNTASTTEAKKPYYHIASLEKGVRILEALAQHGPLPLSELTRLVGQTKSATHRFLSTWRDLGYVEHDAHNRYRATLKIFGLAHKLVDRLEVRSLARIKMQALLNRYGETVNLGCLEGQEAVVIEVLRSNNPLQCHQTIGSRGTAHSTALGKAILAFSHPTVLSSYLQEMDRLPAPTAHTCTSPEELTKELEQIRRQGFALDNEEWALGIRCVAVPVMDYRQVAAFALSLSGPVQRMSDHKVRSMLYDLQAAAREISALLGASPPMAAPASQP